MNQSIPASKELEDKVMNLLESGQFNLRQISNHLNISYAASIFQK